MDDEIVSLRGPIEREGSRLVLRIPLDEGGGDLHLVCEQISEIDGDDLVVSIPFWLAEKIQVAEGTMVHVDNRGGTLNISKVEVQ
ncbi:MAG: hypothetical protein ACJ71S_05250 [Acidobacteriaceae bacterium]